MDEGSYRSTTATDGSTQAGAESGARRPSRRKSPSGTRPHAGNRRPSGGTAGGEAANRSGRGTGLRGRKRRSTASPRKESALRKLMNSWWDRLLGAASDRSFSAQEEQYASHRTSRDFMWNSIGLAAWGMAFPLLTIIITQLVGIELAGMFSLAFVTASLLMIIGNYGVRTYQISDLDEAHSFSDYQISRWITCLAMLIIGFLYCTIRGYTGDMFLISIGVYLYKMVDALADVYEGRLQQKDKLYLAGISQTIRSVSVLVVFTVFLFVSRNLGGASIAMAVTAIASFVIVTGPLALFETEGSRKASLASVKQLFVECAPLFVALFLYAFIDNMPKFMMEGALTYDNQLLFNALYFPAQAILMTVGLIYKPLLVKMAAAWADVRHRGRFDLFIIVMVVVILAITGIGVFLMNWVGIPVMSFLYGVDFEPYRQLSLIMLAAGGVTGIIDFLYQVITVLRKQKVVMRLYLMTFACSLFVPALMISMTGLTGAVMSYLVLMSILLVLLLWEYISVRVAYRRDPASEELAGDEPLGGVSFSDNALMIQQGSTMLGAYPSMYTGVKPAKSTGAGRARRRRAVSGELSPDTPPSPPTEVEGARPAPDGAPGEERRAEARPSDAGAAFRREMAARVDGDRNAGPDDE